MELRFPGLASDRDPGELRGGGEAAGGKEVTMGQYGRGHEGWPGGTDAAQERTIMASNLGCAAGK